MTVWPVTTFTAVTFPDTPKLRSAVLAGSMVPEADTVCFMVPVVTATTCEVISSGEVDAELPVPSQTPRLAPRTTMTAPAAMIMFRLRLLRRGGASWISGPSSTTGTSWVVSEAKCCASSTLLGMTIGRY